MFRHRSIQRIVVSVLAMALFCIGITTSFASRKDPGLPGNHLVIERVDIDVPVNGQLTITGDHFDFGNALAVQLGSPPIDLNIVSATTTTIVADLPPGPPLVGDHLLTVSTGNGQSQNDEYDLTFGAVGAITYLVSFTDTKSANLANGIVSATCNPGDVLTGHGFAFDSSAVDARVTGVNFSKDGAVPQPGESLNRVSVSIFGTGEFDITARAICLDVTP